MDNIETIDNIENAENMDIQEQKNSTVTSPSATRTTDLIIGSVTVAFANVNTATNTGGTTNVLIYAGSGILFATTADLIIGGTTVAHSNVIAVSSQAKRACIA